MNFSEKSLRVSGKRRGEMKVWMPLENFRKKKLINFYEGQLFKQMILNLY